MSRFVSLVLLVAVALPCAVSAQSKPSKESIRQLLSLTESRKLVDGAMTHIDAAMQESLRRELAGKMITADHQRILDDMRMDVVAVFKQEMHWEILEPLILDIYERSFTQKEIDGMLDFYRSEPGKAVIGKCPSSCNTPCRSCRGG